MKKLPLIALSLLACIFTLNAQEISFTFTANHTCEYAPLDSVVVENLTQGGDTVLYWNDTILTIVLTGVEMQTAMGNDFQVSQNYPNPFSSKTKIDVFVPEQDDFTINVYDVTGRQIITYKNKMERGMHNFTFNAGNSNNYILAVNSTKYVEKKLMIRVGTDDNSAASLTYNGIIPEVKSMLKSVKSNFVYEIGDNLEFSGYVDGDFASITDAPTTDEDYLFDISNTAPSSPTAGTHVPGENQIVWNWNPVVDATGYKYNTADDYATATDNGTDTTYTQPGLDCGTACTIYVWAYNGCGQSSSVTLTATTSDCPFTCGSTLTINHDDNGGVAPVDKTVSYGTVSTNLTGSTNCWITQNLGADNQASSATDNTEASAGWYWQFNRKQGYKVGPTPAWTITSIDEDSNWLAANDPCTIELGTGWRIPTYAEWFNADANGGWDNYNDTYSSVLKLHAAGYLLNVNGGLMGSGIYGFYWSSQQWNTTNGWFLIFYDSTSVLSNHFYLKVDGLSVRCLKH